MTGFPVLPCLLEFTQIRVHWVSDAIQSSHPLSSPSPPGILSPGICSNSCPWSQWCYLIISSSATPPFAFNLSQHQGLFKWVSSLHQVTKYWSFSFSISPSNEYSRLISFRMDWLDLLAVQGTLKSLLQQHIAKASVLRWSAVTYIHDYWKNHSLD